jgi:hypothetical protein
MTAPAPSDPFSDPTKSETELSGPLPEFSSFPKLPLELRLEIWNLSMLPFARFPAWRNKEHAIKSFHF